MERLTLDLLLAAVLGYYAWTSFNFTPAIARRRTLAHTMDHLRQLQTIQRDILAPERRETLRKLLEEGDALRLDASVELKPWLERASAFAKNNRPLNWWADKAEVIIVAFGLAFAIRALALQPFKIPTGSMQPTLHGVNVIETDSTPQGLRKKLDWLYYGRTPVDIIAQRDHHGIAKIVSSDPNDGSKTFPKTIFEIDDCTYTFPGSSYDFAKAFKTGGAQSFMLTVRAGHPIFRGYIETGDQLFVNRVSLNWREPRRGDITIFRTDGIRYNGHPLAGRFFVKRLVGLPGEALRLHNDGSLEVREAGSKDFRAVTEADHPHFKAIFSRQGGYQGYGRPPFISLSSEADGDGQPVAFTFGGRRLLPDGSPGSFSGDGASLQLLPDQAVLTTPEAIWTFAPLTADSWRLLSMKRADGFERHCTEDSDTIVLGPAQYFMMGDNSSNSQDSRYWGPVPRANIVGIACNVFWPFSERWGLVAPTHSER